VAFRRMSWCSLATSAQPVAFDHKPLCGRLDDISARIASWLANEEDFGSRFSPASRQRLPNFSRIIELNEAGLLPEGDPTDLEAGAKSLCDLLAHARKPFRLSPFGPSRKLRAIHTPGSCERLCRRDGRH
jgi:hypothetical protein